MVILIADSHPAPAKNNPTTAIEIWTLQANRATPTVVTVQVMTIDIFLP